MACGIPLISAPWDDAEHLFRTGQDYLIAEDGEAMKSRLRDVLSDDDLASSLIRSGRETILARHTCRHRVDELLAILPQCGTARVTEKLAAREAAE
jgi:spore maturation protein CgeB